MQMVVLGTSNCVGGDSFIEQLCARSTVRLQNLSIGACSSNLGLYQIDEIVPAARGIGLIDYSINDNDIGVSLPETSNADGMIAGNIRTIANRLRSNDYLPIVVIVPCRLDADTELPAETVHREVSLRNGINFINLRAMFRAALARGARQGGLMRDNFHMSKSAAGIVAGFFADVIDQMRRTTPARATQTASVTPSRVVFARELFSKGSLIELGSTLRKAQYGRLHVGEVMRIPAQRDEHVAGIMINSGAKGATLAIRGGGKEVIKAMTAYWQNEHPCVYSALLIDVVRQITGGDDGVTLEIVPSDTAPTERTVHEQPVCDDRYGEVEIEGVLLTRSHDAEIQTSDTRYRWMPGDLAELPQSRRAFGELLKL